MPLLHSPAGRLDLTLMDHFAVKIQGGGGKAYIPSLPQLPCPSCVSETHIALPAVRSVVIRLSGLLRGSLIIVSRCTYCA